MPIIATWMMVIISPPSTPSTAPPKIWFCLGVNDGLHEAARLARLQGTDHGIHGQFRYVDVASLFSGIIFTQANTAKLGIDEDGVGDKAILRAGAAMLKKNGRPEERRLHCHGQG
jgi:hypothetical protein